MGISIVDREKADTQRQRSYEKQRASLERQRQKQRDKQADPEYRASKFEQQQRQQERQRERQMEKLCDPEYRERMKKNKAASIERYMANAKLKPPVTIKSDTKSRAKPKSKGLMGRTPTALERSLMDKIGALPCAACSAMGIDNTVIALHHVDGRVKPNAHAKVLPLCAYHHDVPLTPEERAIHGDMFPVHAKGSYGGKKAFETAYGTQDLLLSVVYELIEEPRPWLSISS